MAPNNEGTYVTIDGVAALPIMELSAGASIDLPAGESIIVRDSEGNVLLNEVGPQTLSGPITLP